METTSARIGTSGWSYDSWDEVLYPPGTPARDRLAHYVQRFDTVELNASFYRWPRETTFAGWRRRLPPGFALSVKAPRGLTHAKRLYAPEVWIERITTCWHELADRRGVLLVQLAPAHERDDARLDYFLGLLPPWLPAAVEFRHPSWVDEDVFTSTSTTTPKETPSVTPVRCVRCSPGELPKGRAHDCGHTPWTCTA